jgi:hypothetical protein
VYDRVVPSAQNCVSCGTYVTPATSFMTEHGLLCWPCQTRMQNRQEATARAVNDLERSLARRSSQNGYAHWIMWGFAAIIAAANLSGWLGGILILFTLVLGFGLAWRAEWAFWMALSLDVAATLGLILLGATGPMTGRPLGLMLLAVFPAGLALMVWTLRSAYLPPRGPGSSGSGIGKIG